MDAVSQVLAARHDADDPLSRMIGASVVVHVALFAAVLLIPAAWMGAQTAAPEAVMTVSLAGTEGPDNGGRATEASRTVQEIAPPTTRPEPVAPPAAATPEMVEPVKELPKRPPPKAPPKVEQTAPDRTTRQTPTRGDEVRRGEAVAETNVRGQGFGGLSSGGGLGATVDVGDFCCRAYLVTMQSRIRERWERNQSSGGSVVVRFAIQRDGAISDVLVERTSGNAILDLVATRAVRLAQPLPPLPAEYTNSSLTVHLTFEYLR